MEYVFDNVSKNILWTYLTTPTGLSEWFADDVSINNNIFIFTWNKFSQKAERIASNHTYIRFRWLDDEDEHAYFEFRMETAEITGATVLQITDFVEPAEKQDSINLWDTEIKVLKRILGI